MLVNLPGGAVLELLAKTLTELASVAGSAARGAGQERREVFAPVAGPPIPVESWPACSSGDDVPRDGTATILVADVDDATSTTEHDPGHWVRLLRDGSIREHIAKHGGIEMNAADTPFAVAFSSARNAILCAIGLQRIFAGRAAERPAEPLRVRVGLHVEEAMAKTLCDPGRARLLAARIASQARGGQILVSAALKALAGCDLAFAHEDMIDGTEAGKFCAVYDVCWTGAVAAREASGALFRCDGEYWTIAWRGKRCLMKDVLGLRYIEQLLRHPGREFHVLDLVGGRCPTRVRGGDGVAALDQEAKAAYRQRLRDLRDDLDEAERTCDVGRAARARDEEEALTEQLAAAVGLGGRDRQLASAAERARCTVTQGIRLALKRIRTTLPSLADELRLRVKTGLYCVYIPDPVHPTAWLL
jgi:class 3 adenylate cyclase